MDRLDKYWFLKLTEIQLILYLFLETRLKIIIKLTSVLFIIMLQFLVLFKVL